jgi:hypothetical protein
LEEAALIYVDLLRMVLGKEAVMTGDGQTWLEVVYGGGFWHLQ